MIIRHLSDTHLEFYPAASADVMTPWATDHANRLVPPMPDDADTVLILNGDIGTAKRANGISTFLGLLLPRFKHVIYILGNHEHYHSVMDDTLSVIEASVNENCQNTANLTIAGNNPTKVIVDDVTFMCATLWTDYGGPEAHDVHETAKRCMNDHRVIRKKDVYGWHLVAPPEMIPIHTSTLRTFAEWMTDSDKSRTVICTHHLPSFSAISSRYTSPDLPRQSLNLNHAFASNLDEFILEHSPAVWTFGHTHDSYRGKVGETLLACNPFGYPSEDNEYRGIFDPYARIEV